MFFTNNLLSDRLPYLSRTDKAYELIKRCWATAESVNDDSEESVEEMPDALSAGPELTGTETEESEELLGDSSQESELDAIEQELEEMEDQAGALILDGRYTCACMPCSSCCAWASLIEVHARVPSCKE